MFEMTTSHKQPALLVLFVKHSDSVAIATDAHQLSTMLFIDGRWKDFRFGRKKSFQSSCLS